MKNPFRRVQALTSEELLDIVFSHAAEDAKNLDFDIRRTRYGTTRLKGMEEIARQKEGKRISVAANLFYSKLTSVISIMPREVPKIYQIFEDELVGIEKIENAVAKIKKVANYSKKLQGNYLDKLKKVRSSGQMRVTRKEFYGRLSGMARKIDNELLFLRNGFDVLSKLPNLKDCPTVVLAGLPNVGKTSLLQALTGSKPEIKPYPFTTKGLMIAYFPYKFSEVQIIDTPGLLDRKKKNKIEIHSQIALEKIGDLLIYLFDISETCGYTIDQQMKFFNKIKKDATKPVIAVINKVDVVGVPSVTKITDIVDAISISCDSGKGVDELKKKIISLLK